MSRKLLVLLVLVAFVLRLVPLVLIITGSNFFALYENDSKQYIGMGNALAHGDMFFTSDEASWFPLFRTPGYPIFLSVFYFLGFTDQMIALVQIILDSLSCLLVFKLADILLKNEKAALFAAFLYVINPLFISFSFQLLSETFFLFVFLVTNILFFEFYNKQKETIKPAVIVGLFFGFMIWIRPIAIVFPFIYCLTFYLKHRNHLPILTMIVIPLLFVGLWTARNYVIEGEMTFSATPLWNVVCYYNGAVVNDTSANLDGKEKFIEEYRLYNPPSCTDLNYTQLQNGLGTSQEIILTNPLIFAKKSFIAGFYLFEPVPSHWIARASGDQEGGYFAIPIFNLLSIGYQAILYGFAIFFIVKERRSPLVHLFLMLLIYTIIINATVNYHRYRFPLEVFLIIFAAKYYEEYYKKQAKSVLKIRHTYSD